VSPAKTAEPIKMSFGLRPRVGPRKHVLHRVHVSWEGKILKGNGRPTAKYTLQCKQVCSAVAEMGDRFATIGIS